ncbi:hypothetical protein OL229_12125 [Neisseriaceae bacterium JH1-16]|nr:hypothetical protein [Neisseriaceae bacterium JH1-16]
MKTTTLHLGLAAIGCIALLSPAQAAPQLLQGQIGSAAVVMELNVGKDGKAQGRYFYRKYHRDIALDGARNPDGSVALGENLGYDESRTDLVLRPDGKGGWKGQWQGKKGAAQPISLGPLAPATLPASDVASLAKLRQQQPYEFARLTDLTLRQAREQHFGRYTLRWWQEPVSKVSFFRVVDGYPAPVQERVNRVLESRQWEEVNGYFACALGGAHRGGFDYEQTVTPRLLTDRVLSASVFTSYDCGGAHPDFGDSPINLDVQNGRDLQLEDVLWLGQGKPNIPRDADGYPQNYDYQNKVLGPWLSKTLQQLYPKQMAPQDKDDGCDYRDSGLWALPSWYLLPRGLYVGPSFPRVARACEYPEWSVLPWKLVDPHRGDPTLVAH